MKHARCRALLAPVAYNTSRHQLKYSKNVVFNEFEQQYWTPNENERRALPFFALMQIKFLFLHCLRTFGATGKIRLE